MNTSPHRSTDLAFVICAWLTLGLILAQFLMAGLSMFQNPSIWRCHVMAGLSIGVPIVVMLAIALQRRLRPLSGFVGLLALGYVTQFSLILATQHGLGITWQALHPFNGSLMLTLSIVVLMKAVKLLPPRPDGLRSARSA
jgi:hypothetical protein